MLKIFWNVPLLFWRTKSAFHKRFKAKSQRAKSIAIIFAPFYGNSSCENRFKCVIQFALSDNFFLITESRLLRNVKFVSFAFAVLCLTKSLLIVMFNAPLMLLFLFLLVFFPSSQYKLVKTLNQKQFISMDALSFMS